MKHIVFVGDKPSSKNIDPSIPFVGTQSYRILLDWIWQMDIDISDVTICNKDTLFKNYHRPIGVSFIALGNEAAKELKRQCHSYFKLPHPSPRNRKLNDKKYIALELEKCKNYINGI